MVGRAEVYCPTLSAWLVLGFPKGQELHYAAVPMIALRCQLHRHGCKQTHRHETPPQRCHISIMMMIMVIIMMMVMRMVVVMMTMMTTVIMVMMMMMRMMMMMMMRMNI